VAEMFPKNFPGSELLKNFLTYSSDAYEIEN